MTRSPVVEVCGLAKCYGGRPVLQDVSFALDAGEVVALLGPSGAGKSTLFRCLARLTEHDEGEVRLFGRSLEALPSRELRLLRRNIGLVFQQFNLVQRLTALDNVLAGRLGYVPLWRVLTRRFPRSDRQDALAALERVGLRDKAAQRVDRLSGGQQQRVAIARVLTQQSRLILADEPIASLDPASATSVLALLRSIAHERGHTIFCSLHQVEFVSGFADRVLSLSDGRLVSDASAAPQRIRAVLRSSPIA